MSASEGSCNSEES